jgi:hypothetical protein
VDPKRVVKRNFIDITVYVLISHGRTLKITEIGETNLQCSMVRVR